MQSNHRFCVFRTRAATRSQCHPGEHWQNCERILSPRHLWNCCCCKSFHDCHIQSPDPQSRKLALNCFYISVSASILQMPCKYSYDTVMSARSHRRGCLLCTVCTQADWVHRHRASGHGVSVFMVSLSLECSRHCSWGSPLLYSQSFTWPLTPSPVLNIIENEREAQNNETWPWVTHFPNRGFTTSVCPHLLLIS